MTIRQKEGYDTFMTTIRIATEVTKSLEEAYKVLIPQLSTSSNPPNAGQLQNIIDSDSAQILIAEDEHGRYWEL